MANQEGGAEIRLSRNLKAASGGATSFTTSMESISSTAFSPHYMLEITREYFNRQIEGDANHAAALETSTTHPANDLLEASNLCDRCAAIDGRLSRLQNCTRTKFFARFEPLASPTCDACAFFSRCLSVQPSNRPYYLLAGANYKISKKVPPLRCIKSPILWFVPQFDFERNFEDSQLGIVIMVKETAESRLSCKPIPPLIDFGAARAWYDFCSYTHSDHCFSEPGEHTNLTVIDIQTRRLTLCPPESLYVTLSYVWGVSAQNLNSKVTDDRLPQNLPRTIEDSMEVTSRMGFRYLWVDKYCIDETDLHNQLKMMATVYQNSAITIVAATGKDCSSGLPGVSRPRDQPQRVSFGRSALISVPLLPIEEIETSPWNSRAWTFQEGLLATRRLIFCENQVYFECQSFYCLEGIAPPVDILLELQETGRFQSPGRGIPIAGEKDRTRDFYSIPRPVNAFGVFPLNGCGDRFTDIFDRIGEYSTKSLSYQTDILNAMLGIFESFDKRFGMKHLWGVPYLGHEAPLWGDSPAVSQLFAANSEWPSKKPRARREGFPSWSWVGWFGNFHAMQDSKWRSTLQNHSEMPQPLEDNIHWISKHPARVQIETTEGEVLDLATFEKFSAISTSKDASKFIHVSTFASFLRPIRTLIDPDTPACGFDLAESASVSYGDFALSLDLNIEAHVFNKALVGGKLIALHMPQLQLGGFRNVLIVEEKSGFWERVATAEFYDRNGGFDVIARPHWRTIRLG